jgi:enoyl-CoA hydratase
MTADNGTEPMVLTRTANGVGRITLNRPRAINALNHQMVTTISDILRRWSGDDSVTTVVLDGAGERGFCAGGDIRAIYDDARSGGTASIDFWRDEYRLNVMIARYRKPVVALMDGLVMGGGVGLSAHASHRIVTDRSVIAMPEVTIGLIPDVGGTYLLAKAPGWLGLHAGLTGTRLAAADVIALDMADHYVDHHDLADFTEQISRHGIESAIDKFTGPAPASLLVQQRLWIDDCYNSESASKILGNLRAVNLPEATTAADSIQAASPTSVLAALRAIRWVRNHSPSLETALNQEFRMVCAAVRSTDLIEGIRAQVIDKDRNPTWSPATLDEVSTTDLDRYFRTTDDLPFPEADPTNPPSKGHT